MNTLTEILECVMDIFSISGIQQNFNGKDFFSANTVLNQRAALLECLPWQTLNTCMVLAAN